MGLQPGPTLGPPRFAASGAVAGSLRGTHHAPRARLARQRDSPRRGAGYVPPTLPAPHAGPPSRTRIGPRRVPGAQVRHSSGTRGHALRVPWPAPACGANPGGGGGCRPGPLRASVRCGATGRRAERLPPEERRSRRQPTRSGSRGGHAFHGRDPGVYRDRSTLRGCCPSGEEPPWLENRVMRPMRDSQPRHDPTPTARLVSAPRREAPVALLAGPDAAWPVCRRPATGGAANGRPHAAAPRDGTAIRPRDDLIFFVPARRPVRAIENPPPVRATLF